MPQSTSGAKPRLLWGGVLLSLGLCLVIMPTPITMSAALFLPSLYCLWSASLPRARWLLLSLVPAILGVFPAFQQGTILYGCLIVSGISMWAMMRRSKIGLAVFVPSCILLGVFFLGVFLLAQSADIGPHKLIQQWVSQVMAQVNDMYAVALQPEDMKTFQTQRPLIEATLAHIFPALSATGIIFILWLNLLIVAGAKRSWDLTTWRTPDWVVALFILAALGTFAPQPMLQAAGYNLLIVVSVAYFFQGLSIVAFYLDARHWAAMLRWIIYLLILSQFYIMMAVALGGLFDTWFYFRKRIRREGEQI